MTREKLILRDRIIGVLFRDARDRAGISKRECAEALGVSSWTITAYEEGRKSISLPELEVLAYLLEVPLAHFFEHTPKLSSEEEALPLLKALALRHRIIGALLRRARTDADVAQKDLAEVLGCSPRRISSYEFGERPMPLAELELAAEYLGLPISYFIDTQEGPIGEWHRREAIWQDFRQLPEEVQQFVVKPINIKYLEVAMKLAKMPAGSLRAIAEGLLDITY